MQVPFQNLRAHHEPLAAELEAAFREVLASSAFADGPFVRRFEAHFAAWAGAAEAVGVASGTEALWLTLLALGVGPGDEVLTVPHTFIATAEAISMTGARPVFVDIAEDIYTMDPTQVEPAISPRTKAILPVHIFGLPADLDPILEVAGRHGLPVVEDACQAHGARYKGRPVGTLGVAGCFSFYPSKNLGALGEAGAVITQNRELAAKIRRLRDHGQTRRYCHATIGWNSRMDGLQAAVLDVKLKRLEAANAARRAHAAFYHQRLAGVPGLILPREPAWAQHVWHLYVVRVPHRDRVLDALNGRGIGCAVHYPVPIHLQPAYRFLGLAEGAFPVAERCARQFLSLPMFPELTVDQLDRVCAELAAALNEVCPRT